MLYDDSPGRVTGKGIAGDVGGRVVTGVGLSEVYLQMTSFAAVPDSRTWFPEHLKGKQEKYQPTNQKIWGKKIQSSLIAVAFIFTYFVQFLQGPLGWSLKVPTGQGWQPSTNKNKHICTR